ncbi:hypothetical protein KUTeg_021667 [Tegillarca granosa]|uniref:protein-tyrosine-phosphatase n=1 Tax=Tegillarca granosa TaxID=220873 RepID=A0ABQ9EA30_TEGGR|nr:hypothetical protein KUTeg_021667 [Tegillarca granosa]
MSSPTLDLNEVIDNLFIGSKSAVRNADTLKAKGITHIMTVNDHPLPLVVSQDFKYKFVHGLDLEFTDLLTMFDECYQFIDEGRLQGSVIVHCLAGMSRSATIVIAYIMKKKQIGYGEALGIVREARRVKPNEGFSFQLLLYEEMNFKLDNTNEKYRKYKLKKLALKMQCKHPLFRKSGFLTHKEGEGEAAFDWRSKLSKHQSSDSSKVVNTNSVCDKSIFIEPVRWMKDKIQVPEGKLECPKCSAKIGSFLWYGQRCPCGTWVTPAFHIQTGKVDECKPVLLPDRTSNQLTTNVS